MIDSILRAWAACADADFGGSLDGWESPPCVRPPMAAPPERRSSVWEGVMWVARYAGWRAQPWVRGRRLYGPMRPGTPDGEWQAAWDVAQLHGWDEPRQRPTTGRKAAKRKYGVQA